MEGVGAAGINGAETPADGSDRLAAFGGAALAVVVDAERAPSNTGRLVRVIDAVLATGATATTAVDASSSLMSISSSPAGFCLSDDDAVEDEDRVAAAARDDDDKRFLNIVSSPRHKSAQNATAAVI